jgi:hypothetical protein
MRQAEITTIDEEFRSRHPGPVVDGLEKSSESAKKAWQTRRRGFKGIRKVIPRVGRTKAEQEFLKKENKGIQKLYADVYGKKKASKILQHVKEATRQGLIKPGMKKTPSKWKEYLKKREIEAGN